MTVSRRPSPFSELLSFRNAMDRLFDETVFRPVGGSGERANAMPMDIYSTADALVIEASLPGIRPEDVDVSVLGTTLTLSASHADERSEDVNRYHVRELRRGRMSRTVTLPQGLKTDAATATFEHGVLRLSIPRAEQARPHQIPITTPIEGTSSNSASEQHDASQPDEAAAQPAGE